MPKNQYKLVILIVDDDVDVLCSLRFLLEIEGFGVIAFRCGEDVLGVDTLPPCDCLVIDYQMPAPNGVDLLRALRERQVLAPAVLITGCWEPDITRDARKAGIDHVVHKPNLDAALISSIRSAVASSRAGAGDDGPRPCAGGGRGDNPAAS